MTCRFLISIFVSVLVGQPSDGNQATQYRRSDDSHGFHVFMKEGGWCWFQDPRAIIHQGKLLVGGVQGNGRGDAVVGVFDLKTRRCLGRAVMHQGFNRDDHNSPVLYARPDGRVLAMYALHSKNKTHYYRISDPQDFLAWSEEKQFVHDYPSAGNVTYMNLYAIKDEGKLYNFFRGIEYNPSLITSTDHGSTWGQPRHFIKSELEGRHRPYARYAASGTDTVHVSFTDGHPNRFGNSIYYAAFRKGGFYRADGQMIQVLREDGPLRPSHAELIFQGGGRWAPQGPASADRAAWTSCIAVDGQGYPHIAYSLHLSDADHRFRISSWTGSKWIDREVAYAGHCLYDRETSYTGLITLDPVDPTSVLISTNVDPTTGDNSGGKHEIYRAQCDSEDDIRTIQWEPVTQDSPVRNLRPVIVRGDGNRVLAWLRGQFRSYTDYQLDVVGVIERIE